jgi:hypothetical protein
MKRVRVLTWAIVIVCGALAVPVTSYLDTHRTANLLWALALLALGLALAVITRVVYSRLDPAERQPITPDSRRDAVIRLLLGIGVGAIGIFGLWGTLATGRSVGYVVLAVVIIALGIWTVVDGWRRYRRADSSGGPAGQ